MNKRDKRFHRIRETQFAIADGYIERHRDAINQLEFAKAKLTKLATVDSWTPELARELDAVTLEVRDGNWRQYG